MPLTTQQTELKLALRVRTPPGVAPSYPAYTPARVGETKSVHPNEFDEYRSFLLDNASLNAIMLDPAPAVGVIQPIAERPGFYLASFSATNDEIVWADDYLVAQTGWIINSLGRGLFELQFDPAWRGLFTTSQTITASLQVRARMKWRPGSYVTFAAVTVDTTGTETVVNPPPQNISHFPEQVFSEGTSGTVNIPVGTMFSDSDALTYDATRLDGSGLPAGRLTKGAVFTDGNGVKQLPIAYDFPVAYLDRTDIRIRAIDSQNQTADDFTFFQSTDVPDPVVLSNPPDRSIVDSGASTFQVTLATHFQNASVFTFYLGGVALPTASWSVNVAAGVATFTYPAEGTTRTVTIRGANAAGEFKEVSFQVTRPAAPGTIGTADPIMLQEASTGFFDVDFSLLFVGTSSHSITGPGGAALPANYSVSSPSANIRRVTYTIANNEIRNDAIEYHSDALMLPTFFRSRHNPPNANGQTLAGISDVPLVLPVLAASDDPGNNSIVAGSISSPVSNTTVSGGNITAAQTGSFQGQEFIDFSLVAGSGLGQSVASAGRWTINWALAVAPAANGALTTTAIGTASSTGSLISFFRAGTDPIDWVSTQFIASDGTLLGKSRVIAGVGSFVLDNAGGYSFTPVTGFTGTQPALQISVADVKGRRSSDSGSWLDWTHTQQSAGGEVTNYEPVRQFLVQLGLGEFEPYKGENCYNSTHYLNREIGSNQVVGVPDWPTGVMSGKYAVETDVITVAAGETINMGFVQELWDTFDVDPGTWVIKGNFTGTVEVTKADGAAMTGWTASGGSGTVRRWQKTCGIADAGLRWYISGGASGGTFRRTYIGPSSRENDPANFTPNFLAYVGNVDIIRDLDWALVNGSKMTRYADLLSSSSRAVCSRSNTQPGRGWPASYPATQAERNRLKGGFKPEELIRLAMLSGQSVHFVLPAWLGAEPIENQIWSTAGTTLRGIVRANGASVVAQARIEFNLYANRWFDALVAASWPDNRAILGERSNEDWNADKGLQRNFTFGVGEYLQDTYGSLGTANLVYAGNGWLTAIMMEEFLKVRALKKPNQEIYFVLNVQANTGNGSYDPAMRAIDLYNSISTTGGAPKDHLYISPTQYIKGMLDYQSGAGNPWGVTTDTEWLAQVAAARAVSDANLFNIIRDHFLLTNGGGNHTTSAFVNHQLRCVNYAIANGLRGVYCYEGSFHTLGDTRIPGIDALHDAFIGSAQAKAIAEDALNRFHAIDPRNPAVTTGWQPTRMVLTNYQMIGKDYGKSNPWVEQRASTIGTFPTTGAAGAWNAKGRAAAPGGGNSGGSGSGGGGGGGGSPTLFRRDFEGKTATILGTEGYQMSGAWTVTPDQDGARDTLRGTSLANNAVIAFRASTVVNKSVVWRERLKPDADKTPGGLFQLRDTATNKLEVEMMADGSLRVIAPGGSTVLLDSALGPVPAFDIQDGSFHSLRLSYFSDTTNGSVKLEHWNGSAWVTLHEKTAATEGGTYNSDPHGTASTLYQWQGRYKVQFSDDNGDAGDWTP